MDKTTFQKDWRRFLLEVERSENQIAKEIGQTQQGLNRKIQNASIRYIELSEIVEKYGYSISIHKKEE